MDGRRWEVVDVRDDPEAHGELLQRFYDRLMVPSFPPEELDELDVWRDSLPECYPKSIFHILLARLREEEDGGRDEKAMVGGMLVFEYYLQSRCGFVSYVVVSPVHRGQGLAQRLLDEGARIMHRDALQRHGTPLRAIFLETHSPEKVDAAADVISPHVRVRIMHQLGFRRVVVDFFQPPLAEGKEAFKGLWLGVYQPTAESRTDTIEADLVRAFIDEYWLDCCGPDFADDDVYREMALQFVVPTRTHFAVVDFIEAPITTTSPPPRQQVEAMNGGMFI